MTNVQKINDRLDAVEDLMRYSYETDVCRQKLSKVPDLEKLVAKLYTYSIRHKVKAIYFENVSLTKMREFRQILTHIKKLPTIV